MIQSLISHLTIGVIVGEGIPQKVLHSILVLLVGVHQHHQVGRRDELGQHSQAAVGLAHRLVREADIGGGNTSSGQRN